MESKETPPQSPPRQFLHAALRRLVMLWVTVALLIALVGYGLFIFARNAVIEQQWELLEALAQNRIEDITEWTEGRRDEAGRFLESPEHVDTLRRFLAQNETGAAWPSLVREINILLKRAHYQAIVLTNGEGEVAAWFGSSTATEPPLMELPIAPRGEITFTEVVVDDGGQQEIRIVMTAPLWQQERYLGALLFMIEPPEVGPIRSTWVPPGSTVEILLFHPLPDRVVYLTPPRFLGTPTFVVEPTSELLIARAARGERRIIAPNYQGDIIIAFAGPVPGTPWRLMATIERAEIAQLVTNLGLLAGGLSLLLIALAGSLAMSRFRRLQTQAHNALLEAEMERRALERHFDYLTKYANDVILLMNSDGKIMAANDRAAESYGYSHDQLLDMSIRDLVAPEEIERANKQWNVVRQKQAAIVETMHVNSNGERFPVESSLRLIEVEGETYVQDIMRDISERQKRDERIRRLNRLYLTLSQVNEAVLYTRTVPELMRRICEISIDAGGFVAAWAMLPSDDGKQLEVLNYCGPGEQEFREAMQLPATTIAEGLSASALAARERRTIAINDYQADPRIVLKAWARRYDVRSVAAIPIFVDEILFGICGVYSCDLNAFDPEIVDLFNSMSSDLGYGIRSQRQADALRESEHRLKLVFRATRDCYWDIEFNNNQMYLSPPFRKQLGTAAEWLSLEDAYALLTQRIHPEDLPRAIEELQAHLRGDTPELLSEYRMFMKHDVERWVRSKGRVVQRDANNKPIRMTGVHIDITDERQKEEQLRLWASVFSESREAIVIGDSHRRVISVNRAFCAMTGYTEEETLGKDVFVFAAGLPEFEHAWSVARELGHWQGELHARRKNGEEFPFFAAVTRVQGQAGGADTYITVATDLSEHKAAREQIQFLSYRDSLTGLPNRVLLQDRLDQSINYAREHNTHIAVLYFDLDRFKNINDSLGHSLGDLLIKSLGERLSWSVPPDTTIGRQGGDDFVVLLEKLSNTDAIAQVAQEIMNATSREFTIDGHRITITATIGIAVYPMDGEDSSTLIRNAESAMYYSKEQGRNTFRFFFQELNIRARRRISLESRLRRATDNGDFQLYYQPQNDTLSEAPVGVEALLRWPEGDKLILPEEFIPVAEETGLIIPIGEWVIQEACRQRQEWREQGLGEVLVAVNLSALQFRRKMVMENLQRIISDRCGANAMELELTESVIMEEAEDSIKALYSLKESGVKIAIDDFGTGYSSLSYLRRFPIDRLKVDKSFVRGMPFDATDRAITNAIIHMAKSLGMTVIAEGVETREEFLLLRERGCDQVQGFYFSHPLPSEQLLTWWRQQRSAPVRPA